MTYAKVIADSVTTQGHRLTTMEVRFHRFVLAEFNTHRWFSRNSASSRAIPVSKQLQRVKTDTAFPLEWPAEQKGMQGGEALENEASLRDWWESARDHSVHAVRHLAGMGLHKSVSNRLLEPFMWHTVIVTATDWENFFQQRCSPLAQPEIRAVAELMRDEYNGSNPTLLKDKEWHLPYIEREDYDALYEYVGFRPDVYGQIVVEAKKVSAARCARVSYLTHDGKRDVREDLALYQRLVEADPPHWSPLEHVATPWQQNVDNNINLNFYGETYQEKFGYNTVRPRIGNLTGWRSLRTEAEAVMVS